MIKIVTVIGARPQFVKAAVISKEIANNENITEILVHTGQHYDENMSGLFFEQMKIPRPAYNLAIGNLSHGAMTGRMIEKTEEILLKEKPDYLLVYGDTNSTLAGALAASKLHIPVAHVEAGLRSFNKKMPEEINRILTDHVSDILFCPTDNAIENLRNEGIADSNKVIRTGDVMYDCSMLFSNYAEKPAFNVPEKFVLGTIHRAENTDDPEKLKEIIEALNDINETIPVIIPLHPRTQKLVNSLGLKISFTCIEPIGYLQMTFLLKACSLVVTDSGGLQKEAYFFEKPCVTVRDQTEWVELVTNGVNILSNAQSDDIKNKITMMLNKKLEFNQKLYGEGDAAKKIVTTLVNPGHR